MVSGPPPIDASVITPATMSPDSVGKEPGSARRPGGESMELDDDLELGLPEEPPLDVRNVRLPLCPVSRPGLMRLKGGFVESLGRMPDTPPGGDEPPFATALDGNGGLVLPSLCHPHIHLDKPYLNSLKAQPWISRGDFKEAVELTKFAKDAYTHEDLVERGRRLILDSVEAGVTCMRAHVEVDPTVGFKCVDAALQLKKEFGDDGRGLCDIQVAVFAQEPVFKGTEKEQMVIRRAIFAATEKEGVDVLGTAPYVEETVEKAKKNMEWCVDMAMLHRKHLDFHLDYSLDSKTEPLIHHLIQILIDRRWTTVMPPNLTIALGHCTRLSLFPPYQLSQLRNDIANAGLPIHFIGLPTSDLYMMGRDVAGGPARGGGAVPRGTIPILEWIKTYDFDCALGVNNIGNAFTPFGSVDPLTFLSGIGSIYQGGTEEDCRILLSCVSNRAKKAIGMLGEKESERYKDDGLCPRSGDRADLLVIGGQQRHTVIESAVDPGLDRLVIRRGRVVARRQVLKWIA